MHVPCKGGLDNALGQKRVMAAETYFEEPKYASSLLTAMVGNVDLILILQLKKMMHIQQTANPGGGGVKYPI